MISSKDHIEGEEHHAHESDGGKVQDTEVHESDESMVVKECEPFKDGAGCRTHYA